MQRQKGTTSDQKTMVEVIIRVSNCHLNSCLIASESYLMASDSTHVACKKSFGAQFTGNYCLKAQTDFDEAFAEVCFQTLLLKVN